MSEVSTFRCDECGKIKEEANHWYKALVFRTPPAASKQFMVAPWDSPDLEFVIEDERILHLCGMGCAVKAMTKAMETGKL
jgi:hypothetical protein